MCGIAGSIQFSGGKTLAVEAVDSILARQDRRGPDHRQSVEHFADGLHLVFGHNRLAILDLDERSNQPFADQSFDSLLSYNGEIYNFVELRDELTRLGHSFRTTSDTEVILKAYSEWGVEAFSKFNGMFAFGLFDGRKKQLLLVRDRFGVKPLYYTVQKGALHFASNAKALALSHGLGLNWDYINTGLRYDLYEGVSLESCFSGVRALPPGHVLVFKDSAAALETAPYYRLESRYLDLRENLLGLDEDQLVRSLEELLFDAVRLRLRSDVPVTLSLSGGLDSGICASFMREILGRHFDAFTFGEGRVSGSEAALAKETADHVGVGLVSTGLNAGDVRAIYESTLDAQLVPFGHPTVMAQNRVFQEIHSRGFKVSIGGQGADEAFAGYRKFLLQYLKELRASGAGFKALKEGLGVGCTVAQELFSPQNYFYYFKRMSSSGRGEFYLGGEGRDRVPSVPASASVALHSRQLLDVSVTSLPTLLRYEDSNSMHYSIESRMPFLDYRVIEFGLALPSEMKVRGGYGKWLLRRVAEKRLPRSIVWTRNKRAFSLKPSWWFDSGLTAVMRQTIDENRSVLEPVLSPAMRDLIRDPRNFAIPEHFTKLNTLVWLARNPGFLKS